ncbi:MAG: hypothetical protein AAGJ35_11020, partial [Myxococcota bacterium]
LIRRVPNLIDAFMAQGQPIHVLVHSQGSMIWNKGIALWKEQWIERAHVRTLKSRYLLRFDAEALLKRWVVLETCGNAVSSWTPGPVYLHWVHPRDPAVLLLGTHQPKKTSDGVFVILQGDTRTGTQAHDMHHYARHRARVLKGQSVRQFVMYR